jgi:hypothetical protein
MPTDADGERLLRAGLSQRRIFTKGSFPYDSVGFIQRAECNHTSIEIAHPPCGAATKTICRGTSVHVRSCSHLERVEHALAPLLLDIGANALLGRRSFRAMRVATADCQGTVIKPTRACLISD